MVKKKSKSKRTTFKDKYKIQKRTAETHRKRKKQAKRDAAAGVIRHDKKKKDPGIPNSWPFKQDLLKDIQRMKERQQQRMIDQKEKRKAELEALREHQEHGGSARTVQELMQQAQKDQNQYTKQQQQLNDDNSGNDDDENMDLDDGRKKTDGLSSVAGTSGGQSSRRAYLRELKKVIDTADIILQVLDARDPIGSRIHPTVENTILSRADKKMVLVLNKIDLVPKSIIHDWLSYLRRSHPTIAIKANHAMNNYNNNATSMADDDAATSNSLFLSNVPLGMDGLLQLLKNYARTGNDNNKKNKTTIVVGIIGYPNVGKSSIINALKRSRAVGVSPKPGYTKMMQEIVLDRHVRLLDCPGIVFHDQSTMLGNCIDVDTIDDPIPHISILLSRCDHDSLLMTYNIPTFPKHDVMAFLCLVAKSYGRVLKGGIPDKIAAARAVLKDWNYGKIPFYSVPPINDADQRQNDAIIVNTFSKEYDITQYDHDIMNTLPDKDEMDFVKISDVHDPRDTMIASKATKDAIKFLTNNDDDEKEDDDDDQQEMEEDSAEEEEEEDDDDHDDDVNN